MGSSLGGLFTLYAMFQETELFQRYVLTSPAVGWDNGSIYQLEKNFSEKKTLLPGRLFMAVGELEGETGFQKFVDLLKARNYQGLAMETRVLENIGHSGTKAEGYTRGLQFVFARPSLTIAPGALQKYVGAYQLNPEVRIEVVGENGRLVALTPDKMKFVLYAESEKDFFVKGLMSSPSFKTDAAGKLMGVELEHFNGREFLKRVNYALRGLFAAQPTS